MKLINDLIKIIESTRTESGLTAHIQFFPDHVIYRGHFPGHPVTPGVILIKIVHELIETYLGKKMQLVEIPNCKFLRVINPLEVDKITVTIDLNLKNKLYQSKALGISGPDIFFKLNSVYRCSTIGV
jgi:3-hydroxyacyl-[acyl-carrier-protein] dehydratase